jgi:hypothetical protein
MYRTVLLLQTGTWCLWVGSKYHWRKLKSTGNRHNMEGMFWSLFYLWAFLSQFVSVFAEQNPWVWVSVAERGFSGPSFTVLVCERSCCCLWAFLSLFVSGIFAEQNRWGWDSVEERGEGGWPGHSSCFVSVLGAVCERSCCCLWAVFLCRTKPVSLRFRGGEGGGVDGLVTPPQSYDQLSIEERRWRLPTDWLLHIWLINCFYFMHVTIAIWVGEYGSLFTAA